MKVALDLHDFSVVNNRLDVLLRLKESFPDFKVSLFTVPIDMKADWGSYIIRNRLREKIRGNLDWIQIIPHGLYHKGSEALRWSYHYTRDYVLPMIKRNFFIDGLPFEQGFCAPHWRWTEDVVKALDESGWWGAVDRDKVMPYPKRFYKYNFLLDESYRDSGADLLKLHGHIYGTKNDVARCLDNLLSLPRDTEWHFITDFIEVKYD